MADIFLSYASEDRDRASEVSTSLEARGWSVWWDRHILHGKKFDAEIARELASAKCVVVLWSVSSTISDWVKDEAEDANRRGVLVPALIDDTPIPLGFRRIQTAKLFGSDPEFTSLCDSVTTYVAQPLSIPRVATKLWKPQHGWRRYLPVMAAVVLLVAGAAYAIFHTAPPSSIEYIQYLEAQDALIDGAHNDATFKSTGAEFNHRYESLLKRVRGNESRLAAESNREVIYCRVHRDRQSMGTDPKHKQAIRLVAEGCDSRKIANDVVVAKRELARIFGDVSD